MIMILMDDQFKSRRRYSTLATASLLHVEVGKFRPVKTWHPSVVLLRHLQIIDGPVDVSLQKDTKQYSLRAQ